MSSSFDPIGQRIARLPFVVPISPVVGETDPRRGVAVKLDPQHNKGFFYGVYVAGETRLKDWEMGRYSILGQVYDPLPDMGFYDQDTAEAIQREENRVAEIRANLPRFEDVASDKAQKIAFVDTSKEGKWKPSDIPRGWLRIARYVLISDNDKRAYTFTAERIITGYTKKGKEKMIVQITVFLCESFAKEQKARFLYETEAQRDQLQTLKYYHDGNPLRYLKYNDRPQSIGARARADRQRKERENNISATEAKIKPEGETAP